MTRVRSYRRGSIATIYFLVENRSGSRGFSKRNANVSIRDTVVGGIITERWLPICDVTGTPPRAGLFVLQGRGVAGWASDIKVGLP